MKGALPSASNPVLTKGPLGVGVFTREYYDFLLRLAGLLDGSAGGIPVSDGDYGDITVTVGGTVWTIDPGVVTYAKIQNVSAGSRLLGRGSSGPGNVQEITLGEGLVMAGTELSVDGTCPRTPTFVPDGEDVEIASNSQMLFCMVPTIDGTITIDGTYCEVN